LSLQGTQPSRTLSRLGQLGHLLVLEPRWGCLTNLLLWHYRCRQLLRIVTTLLHLLLITTYHIVHVTKTGSRQRELSPTTLRHLLHKGRGITIITLLLPLLLQILPQLRGRKLALEGLRVTTLLHLLLHLLLPLILLISIVLQNLRHSWACLFRVFPILPHCILYFRGRFVLLLRLLLSK